MSREVADNIKRLRELLHLSQEQLADIANMSRAAVAKWETGKNEPRMGALERIALYAHIPKTLLIEKDGMRFVTLGPDGRLHDDPVARLREMESRGIESADDKAAADRAMARMVVRTAGEARLLDMYRALNDDGKATAVSMIAQLVACRAYEPRE